ncbi:hypothetical protein NQ176_g9135 [Zarea fungicola]|uniref:Uncharacterized protein n=1 Tax=Zarea fungicola TaxID=93591 RepID=A0ACC1MQG9_9HYPO|nr:hypothetical protein NQ176_g9135 [Lecanicillium fungicola]
MQFSAIILAASLALVSASPMPVQMEGSAMEQTDASSANIQLYPELPAPAPAPVPVAPQAAAPPAYIPQPLVNKCQQCQYDCNITGGALGSACLLIKCGIQCIIG